MGSSPRPSQALNLRRPSPLGPLLPFPASVGEDAPVTVDKSGRYWRGEDLADLAEYLRAFQAGGYRVVDVVESVCTGCAGRAFRVLADDAEGCAQRICVACAASVYIADSTEHADDADLRPCECLCSGDTFAAAVASPADPARRSTGSAPKA